MRENGGQIGQFMLDRGYSFESIISECIKSRKRDFCRPVDVIATVRNVHPRFNPRGPWKLSSTGSITAKDSDDTKFGRPFCLDGAQCALGARGEICGRRVFATVLREGE